MGNGEYDVLFCPLVLFSSAERFHRESVLCHMSTAEKRSIGAAELMVIVTHRGINACIGEPKQYELLNSIISCLNYYKKYAFAIQVYLAWFRPRKHAQVIEKNRSLMEQDGLE
jgi:hypothetical protein